MSDQVSRDDVVSRRVLLVSGGVIAVLLAAIGAFLALRRRVVPLWLTRHSTPNPTP